MFNIAKVIYKGRETHIITLDGYFSIVIFHHVKKRDLTIIDKTGDYIKKIGLNGSQNFEYECTAEGICAYKYDLANGNPAKCLHGTPCRFLKRKTKYEPEKIEVK